MSDTPGKQQAKRKHGLGRGLSALMDDYPDTTSGGEAEPADARTAPVDLIAPNPFQPRRNFDADAIAELADSIRANGLLQPILVRPRDGDEGGARYEIVAGERRWRAAQKAGLHDVPIVVRALEDSAALELAILENVQRRDLSPIEEATGYRRLIDDFGHTQDAVAKAVGKSRSHIANLLRLLGLPEAVRKLLDEGALSMGHARALIGAEDPAGLAARVVRDGLTVRQTEKLAGEARPATGKAAGGAPSGAGGKDAETRSLEKDLGQILGLEVALAHSGERGTLTIRYRTLEQLDDVCRRLMGGAGRTGER